MDLASYSPRQLFLLKLSYLGFLLCMIGLPVSPALLSIGSVTLILPAFAMVGVREQLKRFWADKPAFLLSMVFVVHALSFFWTEDKANWLDMVRIKAPLFFTLYSLTVIGPFPRKWVRAGLMLLMVGTFITGTGTVIDYLLHKDQIDLEIQVSKPIKLLFDINHIYFSMIMAVSVFVGIWLYRQKEVLLHRLEGHAMLALALAHVVFLHILTARTGLVAFYAGVFVIGMAYVFLRKKYLLGILLLIGMAGVPVLGYYTVPSLHHRMDNTVEDVNIYFSGGDPNYLSIGTRFESWRSAINIYRDNPLLGVGMADLEPAMYKQYIADGSALCDNNYVLPHNQVIQFMAGFGTLGLLILVAGWFSPFFYRSDTTWLFWAIWVTFSVGMMGESMLERQIGLMLLVLMWMVTRWEPRYPSIEAKQ